jgi:hypothetical protein
MSNGAVLVDAGVVLSNGSRVDARCVMVNADPFRLRELAGEGQFR